MAVSALIATAADPDANTYVTLAEAEALIEDRIQGDAETAWAALAAADKRRYLIQACRMIDAAHRYIGRRVTELTDEEAQALEFPRFSFNYRGGKANIEAYRSAGDYEIDKRVKKAQVAQAIHLVWQVEVSGVGGPVPGGGTRAMLQAEGVAEIGIGNTREKYSGKANALCPEAENWLRPLIRRSHAI